MAPETTSLAEEREALGRALGLNGPVPEDVVRAALESEAYARDLVASRTDPSRRTRLLANPPGRSGHTLPAALLARGARALLRWATAGLRSLDEPAYQRRLEACSRCPYLQEPSADARLLYAAMGAEAHEKAVCGLCGCIVTRKARWITESCPAPHPERAGHTRWGEPIE